MDPRPSAFAYLRLPAPRTPHENATPRPITDLADAEGYCLEGVWVDHGTQTNSFDAMMDAVATSSVKAIFAPSWDDLTAVPRFDHAPPSIIQRYFGLPVFTLDVHRDR